MIVKTQNHAHPNLYLDVTDKSCALEWGVRTAFVGSGVPQPVKIEGIYSKGEVPARLVGDGPFKHWLSIDRVNGMLRYGRGYCTSSLTLFSFKYKTANDEGVMKLDHDKWAWLDDLQEVEVSQIGGSEVSEHTIHIIRTWFNVCIASNSCRCNPLSIDSHSSEIYHRMLSKTKC